ncbi:MAG: hypothetical protein M3Y62_06055 [Candidatus Dormibacteraeota bacterium]|nr:hypothetical protein [Candidatus Dormibacteraeota bacterium]
MRSLVAAGPLALAVLLLMISPVSAVAVPSVGDFSWHPVRCTASPDGSNPELILRVHDAYPGPLAMTGTLLAPQGQKVVFTLKPGDTDILAPGTASSLTLVVQVRGGEGSITNLTLQHSQWAALCLPAQVSFPATGQPFSRGVEKPNPGEGGI